jgi:methylmalonyl-CoA/ethylmalonyl-CoA epimerase
MIFPIATIDNLHSCIAVSNLEESVRWYCDILGFHVLQRHDFLDFSSRVVYLELNGVELELVESKEIKEFKRPDPPVGHVGLQGISQLSFRVKNLNEALDRAKERSVQIVFGPVTVDIFRLKAFFVRDSEGNLIEFTERY